MIYALALATNVDRELNLNQAVEGLSQLGQLQWSAIYEIPCRDQIGADYWNCAALLESNLACGEIVDALKQLELRAGRIRPSHRISLDVDLIAWGETLHEMQFNAKKLPLALDVKIPLSELWKAEGLNVEQHHYPQIAWNSLSKIG